MTSNSSQKNARPELLVSETPVPDATVIWRYFRFGRFVDILKDNSLWFARPCSFDDRWEGLYPPSYIRRTREYADENGISYDEFKEEFRRRELRHRYGHFVNCWHISESESDAMWRLYGLGQNGIAIQSTVGDVRECLRPHNHGQVIYYDPSHDVVSESIFGPHDILFKRLPFSWEHEYRFWFNDHELLERIEQGELIDEDTLAQGRAKSIDDLRRLARRIVIAPGASDGVLGEVKEKCGEYHKRWLGMLIEKSGSDRMWESFTR
jgi:hypothetical protein